MAVTIAVHGIIGSTPREVFVEMIRLANKLELLITCEVNTIHCIAAPGDHPDTLLQTYMRQLQRRET